MFHDSFEEQVRQKALGHEAAVPAGTWEAIARKKKRRYLLLWWWLAGMVVLGSGATVWAYKQGRRQRMSMNAEKVVLAPAAIQAAGSDSAMERTDIQDKNAVIPAMTAKQPVPAPVLRAENNPALSTASVPLLPQYNRQAIQGNKLRPVQQDADIQVPVVSPGMATANSIARAQPTTRTFDSAHGIAGITGTAIATTATAFSPYNYSRHDRVSQFNNIQWPGIHSSLLFPRTDAVPEKATANINTHRKWRGSSKWAIDISVMPFVPIQQGQPLSYITRTMTGPLYKNEYKTDVVHTRLLPAFAYTVAVHKKISPRWRIGAGLQYAMIREKVDMTGKEIRTTYTEIQQLANGSNGPHLVTDTVASVSSGILGIDALNSYKLFSIPVTVQYRLLEKRTWLLQATGGLVLNLPATYHNSIQGELLRFSSQGLHSGRQHQGVGIDLMGGLRLSRKLGSYKLFMEPYLRYNTGAYDLQQMINRKQVHQAGLSIGVTRVLGY